MNILFINSIGRNKYGGGEKWMLHAARGLSDRGHTVIVGGRKNSKFLERAREFNLQTAPLGIYSDFSLVQMVNIARFLKTHRIEVVICNLNKDVQIAGLAARLVGNCVVLARHGLLMYKGQKLRHKLAARTLLDGIITNTETIKTTYGSYHWFNDSFVKVIYNGIRIPDTVVAHDFASRFPGKKIIYSAGRLAEQKGFRYLIEAAALLHKSRHDLVFVISGVGKLEGELREQVKASGLEETFIFEGFTADILPRIKGSDLFVLASLYEGMPNVVMEAMAVAKAVVATDVNGARELMEEGSTGLIVPPQNPQALARAIESLVDDPQKLEEFGKNGYTKVCREFTLNKMVETLEAYLKMKLAEKQSRA